MAKKRSSPLFDPYKPSAKSFFKFYIIPIKYNFGLTIESIGVQHQ
jgi:hypothetical protein